MSEQEIKLFFNELYRCVAYSYITISIIEIVSKFIKSKIIKK